MTGNGNNDIEFRFVDLAHAEFCFESAIHDIHLPFEWKSLSLDSPLMKKHILLRDLLINLECQYVCACMRACNNNNNNKIIN